jgi:hypothetical protein
VSPSPTVASSPVASESATATPSPTPAASTSASPATPGPSTTPTTAPSPGLQPEADWSISSSGLTHSIVGKGSRIKERPRQTENFSERRNRNDRRRRGSVARVGR